MANPFVHVELNTTDPAKAKAFYGSLFSWKMEDVPMGPGAMYTMVQPGEGTGGGIRSTRYPVRRQRGWLTSWSTTSRRQPKRPDRSAPRS